MGLPTSHECHLLDLPGCRKPLTVRSLKEQAKFHSPSLIFLSKTKNKATKLESIRRQLNFEGCFTVKPRGVRGLVFTLEGGGRGRTNPVLRLSD